MSAKRPDMTAEQPAAMPPPPMSYLLRDPEEFARNMVRLMEVSSKAVSTLMGRPDAKVSPYSAAGEVSSAAGVLNDVAKMWLNEPQHLAEAQTKLMIKYGELWNNSIRRMMGEPVQPLVQSEPNDNRFKDADWSENPYFDFWKQAYLITSQWSEGILSETPGLEGETKKRAEFYVRQVTSAFSPTNFPMTNPEVVRETMATNGQNLVTGMSLLVHDMETSGDLLKVSQTDTKAFEVGRNLATTPGKVVYQNELLQLIQYAPTTKTVHEQPLLIVPPWINKFYVLDLGPSKSLIKYVVDQGYTVFVVSWINPDERLAHKTFEDYMIEGLLDAAEAVKRECGTETINVTGYCVGGTLLGTALAYLAGRGETLFNAVTFLTTQVDFREAGDLLLFTTDDQLEGLEELMAERGYLDGSRMANVFNVMRSRDLIWPYIVNNYMLGKKPFPFDLLYWNQDSTRMCAANHAFYLREFYNENRFAKGQMTMGGVKLDLKKVTVPIFELATKEDHIAPARSVYNGARLFGGPVEFVLSGSGHIAGVVNPPDKVKYQYWTGGGPVKPDLDTWLAAAKETAGSWWPYWIKWLAKNSGGQVAARTPGLVLGTVEDAPGSFVKVRS